MSNKAIRLYRFFNMTADKYGKPFALCDKHHREQEQKVPEPCILTKIADKSNLECIKCEA